MDVYLSIGTNIGDKEKNIKIAVSKIANFFDITDISSIYLTTPVGFKDQPKFLNLVVKIRVYETEVISYPEYLLYIIKKIEAELGRKKTFRWGPRIIDIDILLIDNMIYKSNVLEIPHKELLNRNFVLIPLSELIEEINVGEKSFAIQNLIKINELKQDSVILYMRKEKVKQWIFDER